MELRQVELFIRRTGHPERRMLLPRGDVVLGRAEDADVVLSDVGVSRRHAKIAVSSEGVRIDDLESGNGTFIGARKVAGTPLKDGDEIRIDPFVLTFRMVYEGAKAPVPHLALPTIARLEVVSAHAIGKGNFTLPVEGVLTLGRAEDNDIVLPEPSSSRHHAEVHGAGGAWVVRDLGSANGTLINGVAAPERVLHEGDRVMIGAVEFRFTQTLAPVEAEFGDRTEQFDGVLDAPPAAPGRPSPPAGNVPTRLSTAPTLVGGALPPPSLEAARTLPPGELPREMPFSRRTDSLPPRPGPARPDRGAMPAAPPPAPPNRMPPLDRTVEPYRASPPRRRSFLSNPVNQISLGVVLFAMSLVGLWVVKEVADVVIARVHAPSLAQSPASSRAEPAPAVVAAEPPAPSVSAAGTPPVVAATVAADPVGVAPEPIPAPVVATEPTPAGEPVAAAEPVARPPVAAAPAPRSPAQAAVAPSVGALTTAPAGSPRVAPREGAPPPTTEADQLVVDGRRMLDGGRLFDAAAAFFKAVQLEPTNTSAEHWGYAACELIAIDHMRGAMKGVVAPPPPASSRGR